MIVRSYIDAYMVYYVLKIIKAQTLPDVYKIYLPFLPIEDLDQRELKTFS